MKTKEIAQSYLILKGAKLTKMDDEDKFKIIKAMREMRPIVDKYTTDEKEAIEKLEDEEYKEMLEKADKHNNALKGDEKSDILPPPELKKLQDYFTKTEELKNNCLRELQEEDHDLKFDKLSEEAFGKLIASNDFTVEQMLILEEVLW